MQKRRFEHASVTGNGRYAITSICGNQPQSIFRDIARVQLTDDRETAEKLLTSACDSKHCGRFHERFDLQADLDVFTRMSDHYWERERRA